MDEAAERPGGVDKAHRSKRRDPRRMRGYGPCAFPSPQRACARSGIDASTGRARPTAAPRHCATRRTHHAFSRVDVKTTTFQKMNSKLKEKGEIWNSGEERVLPECKVEEACTENILGAAFARMMIQLRFMEEGQRLTQMLVLSADTAFGRHGVE
jgi:hypothetical protein